MKDGEYKLALVGREEILHPLIEGVAEKIDRGADVSIHPAANLEGGLKLYKEKEIDFTISSLYFDSRTEEMETAVREYLETTAAGSADRRVPSSVYLALQNSVRSHSEKIERAREVLGKNVDRMLEVAERDIREIESSLIGEGYSDLELARRPKDIERDSNIVDNLLYRAVNEEPNPPFVVCTDKELKGWEEYPELKAIEDITGKKVKRVVSHPRGQDLEVGETPVEDAYKKACGMMARRDISDRDVKDKKGEYRRVMKERFSIE
ncbi:MAG: hypothetical protein SVV03_00495 [Candidatus Nanohaloarchaea archaeon]|nr:hypothetical protein [Candidatus Nanohaloarchaea archaeon]